MIGCKWRNCVDPRRRTKSRRSPHALLRNRKRLFGGIHRRHNADVRQIPVSLRIIHSVPNHKKVRNRKPHVVRVNLLNPPRRLVKKRRNPQRLRMLLQEKLAQVSKRQTGVQNVFHHQYILALDRVIEVLDHLHSARRSLTLAVARRRHKVERSIHLDRSRKIGQKGRRALQHANHHQFFAVQVMGNLCAHFGNALRNLLARKKYVESLVSQGSHAPSIARIHPGYVAVQIPPLFLGVGRGPRPPRAEAPGSRF